MPSKFVTLKQAAQALGVTPDELVDMRSQGEIFGFRDGSSWKFKTDELERVAAERGTELNLSAADDGDSDDLDLSLAEESELDLSKPLFGDEEEATEPKDSSGLGDLLASDDDQEMDLEDDADSLLVSDDTPLGSDAGGSTIIGATPNPDSDLQLAGDDDDDVLGPSLTGGGTGESSILGGEMDIASQTPEDGGSGMKLVPSSDGSDVTIVPDSDELLVGPDASGIGGSADVGGGELELSEGTGDLDLGSSGDDLDLSTSSGTGDLELSVGSGTGDLELSLDSGSLDLDDDDLSLEDDDELVLGDSSASDVTLGTGDTGINLTSPSDSGLSLEEDPIDIGSAASSLELPEEEVISLEESADPDAATQLKQDEEFLLSPGDAMDEDDSGSQVIALEDSAAFDQEAATMLGDQAFGQGLEAQVQPMPGGAPGAAYTQAGAPATLPGAAGVPLEAPREKPYSIAMVLLLMLITGVLSLSGMLMMDVVRNMWSWDSNGGPVSTGIMDGLLQALKLR